MNLMQPLKRLLSKRSAKPAALRPIRLGFDPLEDRVTPTVYAVSTHGVDVAGHGSTAAPFATIQYAVNAASSGDSILVAEGIYTYKPGADPNASAIGTSAVVSVYKKQLTILGGYNDANWGAARDVNNNLTVIDGGNTYRGVLVYAGTSATSLRMEGFTIQNCLGRAYLSKSGDLSIFGYGGGMYIEMTSQPTINVSFQLRDLIFQNDVASGENTATAYGGAGMGGGLAVRGATNVVMERVTFQNTRAFGGFGGVRGGYALGGGMLADHSTIVGTQVNFVNDVAQGGSTGGSGSMTDGSEADGDGGGMALTNGASFTLTSGYFKSNTAQGGLATSTGGGGFGGAVHLESNATLNLTDSSIVSNVAQGGTAVNGGTGAGGGIDVYNAALFLNRVTIALNMAFGGVTRTNGSAGSVGGGGLFLSRLDATPRPATLNNCVIDDNTAAFAGLGTTTIGGGGGAIWLQGMTLNLTQCTLANNVLGPNLYYGQAIVLIATGAPTGSSIANIAFSIVANHLNTTNNAAVYAFQGTTVNMNRLMYANNNRNSNAPDTSPIPGLYTGVATIIKTADARFVSAGSPNYDYHLKGDSPAIDAATGSGAAVDRDNQPRSAPADIGAYEFQPAVVQLVASTNTYVYENAGSVTITVTRTGTTNNAATVNYVLSDGTAHAGVDYTAASGSVSFKAGETTKTFQVTILDNNLPDLLFRTFNVSLTSPTPGTKLGAAAVTITIIDNEGNDAARFLGGAYQALLHQPVDAPSFASWEINVLQPAFTAAQTQVATSFLNLDEYHNWLTATYFNQFLGRVPLPADVTYWNGQRVAYAKSVSSEVQVIALIASGGESIAHFGNSVTAWLQNLYQQLLGRPIDSATLTSMTNQINAGTSRTTIALSVLNSAEYRTRLVSGYFTTFLGRSGTTAEINSNVARLSTQSEQQVILSLVTSAEYLRLQGNDDANWIRKLYSDLLHRNADSTGLYNYMNQLLGAFAPQRNQVISSLINCDQYRGTLVGDLFTQYLHRAVDSGNLNNFVGLMNNGLTYEGLEAKVLALPEYYQNRANGSNLLWIRAMYNDVLGRASTPVEESQLLNLLAGGATREQAALTVVSTDAAHMQYIRVTYQALLGRAVSNGELQAWANSFHTTGLKPQNLQAAILGINEWYVLPHQYV